MSYISNDKDRCVKLAVYLVENRTTVRSVANKFGISKSTVHKDITETLQHVNHNLYCEAKSVLELNKKERHIRGGEATKNKYKNLKNEK